MSIKIPNRHLIFKRIKPYLLCGFLFLFAFPFACFSAVPVDEYFVSVTRFGAVADAKRIDGQWVGTDNAQAFNKCAAYCRATGLTMLVPKGNYGVASTVWLTNPGLDGNEQAAISVTGSNLGAFRRQSKSANICVLKDFKPGKIIEVKKKDGIVKEPHTVPVLAISNGRQVHIQGLGIQGSNKNDLICGVAMGNGSQMTSIKNCSLENTYVGIMFPGLRPSLSESVKDGNNDLLVVELCTFNNIYNIVCAGTQPCACEYRNNSFKCSRSIFTGNLVTNYYGQSEGSHKFILNLFGTGCDFLEDEVVYFDLMNNNITIDNCHFETSCLQRQIPEILIRCFPNGGASYQTSRVAFTNNTVNFANQYKNPSKYTPLIDMLAGNKTIVQGNRFNVGTAVRIKSYGGIFIGNAFKLAAAHNLEIKDDVQALATGDENVREGLYDFNHFIRSDSKVIISLPNGTILKEHVDYKVRKDLNAFEITAAGKDEINAAKANKVLITYTANDASRIVFQAWDKNKLSPPNGWSSKDLIFIGNKVVGRTDDGNFIERELRAEIKQ